MERLASTRQVQWINGNRGPESGQGSLPRSSKSATDSTSISEEARQTDADGSGGTIPDFTERPGDLQRALEYVKEHAYRLKDDGTRGQLSEKRQRQLASSLTQFPDHLLDKIYANGVDFAVADSRKTPKGGYPGLEKDEPWPRGVAGAYDPESKTLLINGPKTFRGTDQAANQDRLDRLIAHEGGHALDDALAAGRGTTASRTDPAFKEAFREYTRPIDEFYDRHPGQLSAEEKKELGRLMKSVTFDKYGGPSLSSPEEGFGYGMEYYLGTPEERQRLQERAPALFDYFERLFQGDLGAV